MTAAAVSWFDGTAGRAAVVCWAALAGALLPVAPAASAVLVGIPLLTAGLAARPLYWAIAAVGWALLGPTFIDLGAFPGAAERLDLILTWGGLGLALATRASSLPLARGLVLGLLALGTAFLLSGLAGASAPGAVVLGLLLLGAPVALISTILLDPPSASSRRSFLWFLLALAFLQVPVCFVQWLGAAHPDFVKGTLVGTTMGHHAIGAVCGVAAIWLVSRVRRPLELLAVLPLLLVLFWTDSKQVILALPLAALLSPAATRVTAAVRLTLAASAAVALLLVPTLSSAYDYAGKQLEQLTTGDARKVLAVERVGSEVASSPERLAFGLGPGNSVGFVALLADPLNDPTQRNELAGALGLRPSELAGDLAVDELYSNSSFGSQYSSLVGLFGDLGIFGALVYAGLLAAVIVSLWRSRGPEDAGAIAALALMLVLGVAYIWWEYIPFTLYVAALAGLALVRPREPDTRQP